MRITLSLFVLLSAGTQAFRLPGAPRSNDYNAKTRAPVSCPKWLTAGCVATSLLINPISADAALKKGAEPQSFGLLETFKEEKSTAEQASSASDARRQAVEAQAEKARQLAEKKSQEAAARAKATKAEETTSKTS